jgi:iron complex outermembrane receptor protein
MRADQSRARRKTRSRFAPSSCDPWHAREKMHAMASLSEVDRHCCTDFERSSLRSSLLWVPGVQMDERGHGGSTRLSIRGSLLRAPYGVLGVKVYWGPFPLHLADGSTPLELLDPFAREGDRSRSKCRRPTVRQPAPSGILLSAPPHLERAPVRTSSAKMIGGPERLLSPRSGRGHLRARERLVCRVVHQRNDGLP